MVLTPSTMLPLGTCAALDALLAGKPIAKEQKPSLGCNIKWRAGNEPAYFGAR